MIAPHTEVYTKDRDTWLLPNLRDAVKSRRGPDPEPEQYARELDCSKYQVRAALEALEIEGEVLA